MLTAGVDVLHIERVERALREHGDRFAARVFTPAEREYCAGRAASFAVRFAAKEAVGKALGVGMRILHRDGIGWHEAEIIGDDNGKPVVRLHGGAARRAAQLGLTQWSVSLTHERDVAIAFVVAM